MPLKIIQLSDCHLSADSRAPYRGENAGENLERVWANAQTCRPDLVLLTGDLSEDGSAASYERLTEIVRPDVPVLALPGNHDVPAQMRRAFPLGPWDGPLAYEQGDWLIVMTDSTIPGRIEGRFSAESLRRVDAALSESDKAHVLLALHHQPVPVGASWIDRYALAEPEGFLGLVDGEPRVRCVMWGHIHHHFAAQRGDVLFLGGPSTAANSLPRADRFDADPAGPACHRIELGSGGAVAYAQLYANG